MSFMLLEKCFPGPIRLRWLIIPKLMKRLLTVTRINPWNDAFLGTALIDEMLAILECCIDRRTWLNRKGLGEFKEGTTPCLRIAEDWHWG